MTCLSKKPPKISDEKWQDHCTSFLDEEICIEAKVTIHPDVTVGKVEIQCLDSSIEEKEGSKIQKKSSDECTIMVSQLIRVKIPISFHVNAGAEVKGVSCLPCDLDESSDESSSSSSSSGSSSSRSSSSSSSSI